MDNRLKVLEDLDELVQSLDELDIATRRLLCCVRKVESRLQEMAYALVAGLIVLLIMIAVVWVTYNGWL